MEKFVAKFTRNLYIIPGGYFLVQLLRTLFQPKVTGPIWRTFTFQGIRMKVDISKSMGASIYWRGAHDWRPLFVLEKKLKAGATFIDIGANQGEYALWALRKVGIEGKIIAFEPMDSLFLHLQENFNLNPKFKEVLLPIKMGLSDQPGEISLYGKEGDNEGVNTIFPTQSHKVLIQKISLDTLDNQLATIKCQEVDVVKIDVEGAELQVLKGSIMTIKKYSPQFIIEINQEACRAAGYEAEEILHFLKGYSYSFYQIGLRGKLKAISDLNGSFCNILAMPSNREE
ncbi:FkbM family methyltransferase [Cecembia sp.]|uniref:FkbM family methyltransferase n=1 Tax=Cecembia sp. TaxID=1898110 RepID=UPI0025BDD25F|nr:FkbM family methyltransferase [Cecembia sp.]